MTQVYKPMIVLNVYLEPQFRKELIEKVYADILKLSDDKRRDLLKISKELLNIAGFRNPMSAPLPLRVRAAEAKFEKESRFVKQIMASWADLHRNVQAAALDNLKSLGFEVSDTAPLYDDPENAFIIGWPDNIDYNEVHETLSKDLENKLTNDENALLAIWLTGRLP